MLKIVTHQCEQRRVAVLLKPALHEVRAAGTVDRGVRDPHNRCDTLAWLPSADNQSLRISFIIAF